MRFRLPSKLERCPTCGRKHRRSNHANARYWLLLHTIAEKLQPKGESYSADIWHCWAKTRFIGADDVKLPNGKVIIQPRSTASLDVAEFNDYMTKLEAWAADHDVHLDELPE